MAYCDSFISDSVDCLWTSMPIKSILHCVMSIYGPVNKRVYFHIMVQVLALTAL